jgi:hypothetical protein
MTIIRLSNSPIGVFVDDADLAAFTWRLKTSDHKTYPVISVRQGGRVKTLRMHRVIAARKGLCVRKGMDVHHVNGHRFDNRRENLEACGHVYHGRRHSHSRTMV